MRLKRIIIFSGSSCEHNSYFEHMRSPSSRQIPLFVCSEMTRSQSKLITSCSTSYRSAYNSRSEVSCLRVSRSGWRQTGVTIRYINWGERGVRCRHLAPEQVLVGGCCRKERWMDWVRWRSAHAVRRMTSVVISTELLPWREALLISLETLLLGEQVVLPLDKLESGGGSWPPSSRRESNYPI